MLVVTGAISIAVLVLNYIFSKKHASDTQSSSLLQS
jgi:hypothetical protein